MNVPMCTACVWLLLCLPALAAASNNDPPPDSPVGWQAGDNHRGTWNITSNCISTIFACTWSVKHLNIPQDGSGKWSRWLQSFKWMAITILFPELIVVHAIFEFAMALEALRLMEQDGQKRVALPWWLPPRPSSSSPLQRLSHLLRCFPYLLSRSGKQHDVVDLELVDLERHSVQEDGEKWTFTHCFFANMGGFYYEGGQGRFPLTALQLAKETEGFAFPNITEEEIQDRSKQDWFAKIVAALQFLQLALSIIIRTNQGLAFSQLETITLGFAVCGAVIYLVYFYKPQNVETRTRLTRLSETPRSEPPRSGREPPRSGREPPRSESPRSESPRCESSKSESPQSEPAQSEPAPRGPSGDLRFEKTFDSLWDVLINERNHSNSAYAMASDEAPEEIPERIPNDNIPISQSTVAHPGVSLLAFASGLFGAMHAIAWHFEFPSTVERILWQTATVVAAGSPVLGLVTIPLAQLTISAGDSQLFMGNCLRLMREYSWHVSMKDPVNKAYEELEKVLAMSDTTKPEAKRPYDSIFGDGNRARALDLIHELHKFLEMEDPFAQTGTPPLDLQSDKEFKQQFQQLVAIMEGKESKKLTDTARTNVFPRKNFFPKTLNRGILYATAFLYCLSRLSLLAVAFSSLRKMPQSVYVTTPWTAYIPTLGSGN